MKKSGHPSTAVAGGPNGTLDREVVQHFLGFLEGRLRVDIPAWWGHSLLEGSYYSNSPLILLSGERIPGGRPYIPVAGGLNAPRGIEVASEAGAVRITRDREAIVLTKGMIERVSKEFGGPGGVNVLFADASRCVVALHGYACGMYPLFCIDPKTNHIYWQAVVWGDSGKYGTSGTGYYHWTDFRKVDETVVLFGATRYAIYIESFSLVDGHNIFRFSSSY